MDTGIALALLIEIVGYLLWIRFSKSGQSRYKDIVSATMFIVSLLILYRIFTLNIDFGLVLAIASLLSAISWAIGKFLNLDELKTESRSYFFILIIITCIRSFAYEPYQIPSRSMVPGLQIGDFVLVNKHAYGFKFPGTNYLIGKFNPPERNDVAVFIPPHTLCEVQPTEARPDLANLSAAESQLFLNRFLSLQSSRCVPMGIKYVKRIIGIPGDTVVIRGYEIWINGNKLDQREISSDSQQTLLEETLDETVHIVRTLGLSEYEQYEWIVPKGRYLAIGDNRDNSLDSRAWGYFSEDYLIGRADYIWMQWKSFSELPSLARNQKIR